MCNILRVAIVMAIGEIGGRGDDVGGESVVDSYDGNILYNLCVI